VKRIYIKASPDGQISEVQRLPSKMPMPEGYTAEVPNDENAALLMRFGGRRFYLDNGVLKPRQTVAWTVAPGERVKVPGPVTISAPGIDTDLHVVINRADQAVVPAGDALVVEWENVAAITIELDEVRFWAPALLIYFE
jgi:hypothetical protein